MGCAGRSGGGWGGYCTIGCVGWLGLGKAGLGWLGLGRLGSLDLVCVLELSWVGWIVDLCCLPVLSTCPLHTNSGCGKERRISIGPW